MCDTIDDSKQNPVAPDGGTIQFSLKKSDTAEIAAEPTDTAEPEQQELLKPQAIPTEFEDVFSDAQTEAEGTGDDGVVGIEEVFRRNASMINEDFHNETGEEEGESSPKLKKAAIVIGIISGAIVLAALAVALILLL